MEWKINGEFITIDTAEKLMEYEKLKRERNNIINYLKNQIKISSNNIAKYKQINEKNMLLIARITYNLSSEILKMINEKI